MLFWPGGDEDISPNGDNKRTLVDSVADWLNRNDVTVRPFGREILICLSGEGSRRGAGGVAGVRGARLDVRAVMIEECRGIRPITCAEHVRQIGATHEGRRGRGGARRARRGVDARQTQHPRQESTQARSSERAERR